MAKRPIVYKYLWAWDRMMGSLIGWSEMTQALAAKENAPIDAIYRHANGTYATISEVKGEKIREQLNASVAKL